MGVAYKRERGPPGASAPPMPTVLRFAAAWFLPFPPSRHPISADGWEHGAAAARRPRSPWALCPFGWGPLLGPGPPIGALHSHDLSSASAQGRRRRGCGAWSPPRPAAAAAGPYSPSDGLTAGCTPAARAPTAARAGPTPAHMASSSELPAGPGVQPASSPLSHRHGRRMAALCGGGNYLGCLAAGTTTHRLLLPTCMGSA